MGIILSVKSQDSGYTLLELTVVIFIVGIGWFSLIPHLDVSNEVERPIHKINKLIKSASVSDMAKNSIEKVAIDFKKSSFSWNSHVETLGCNIDQIKINSYHKKKKDKAIHFSVYPDGFVDNVIIQASTGEKFVSDPLLCKLRVSKK